MDEAPRCRSPLLADALDEAEATELARSLKAIADPTRVRLLHRLASAAPEGVCVCDLTAPLDLAQPTVSHHLAVLHRAGIVERRREASFVYYSLRSGALDRLAALIATPAGIAG